MGYEELDPKYLDPEVNPFLVEGRGPAFKEKPDPDAKYTDPKQNPFIDGSALEDVAPDPGILARRIATAFPDENEPEIGGVKVTKMGDGSYTVSGKPLAQAPADVLLKLSLELKK